MVSWMWIASPNGGGGSMPSREEQHSWMGRRRGELGEAEAADGDGGGGEGDGEAAGGGGGEGWRRWRQ